VAFGPDDRIRGVRILSSGDTEEHVKQVERHPTFLKSFEKLAWKEAAAREEVDAVSGATLTSLAMVEGLRLRLGGAPASLKFPEQPELERVRVLFPEAAAVASQPGLAGLWRVTDREGATLGLILRTTPAADNVVGYQGPTEALIGLSRPAESKAPGEMVDGLDSTITGLAIGRSYDNDTQMHPYVSYVREEPYFLEFFNGKTIEQLAETDLQEAGVEGVSGATMTSMGVAQGLAATAQRHLADVAAAKAAREKARLKLTARDIGTIAVTLLGVLIGLSPLRGRKWIRYPFLIVLLGYLGFVNGDLVSQALLVGWTQNGVPWRSMLGPLALTGAALLVPLTTRHNVYCTHLCPHGAAQQLLMRRLPWQVRLGPQWHRALSLIPPVLLLWVVVVAVAGLPFSLVDIEPFDAYVPTIAGWATIAIAVVGLVASLFVPMAYCQYGCPTGALLGYLRRHGRSGNIAMRDLWAAALAAVGLVLAFAW
jgi:uncharacterized protein with FMN-binding domain